MTDKTERAWELMRKLDYCMLVSDGPSGLRSRPMSSIVKPEEGAVFFLSNATADQVAEIEANPQVLLAYGDGKTFVSAIGEAGLSRDRSLIARLWNSGAQAFWPEGPERSDVVVISVAPSAAEYWEGDNALVSVAKMATAIATRSTPDLGDNAKVRL